MIGLSRLRLALSRNPDAGFPEGDDRYGYLIVAPIIPMHASLLHTCALALTCKTSTIKNSGFWSTPSVKG